MNKAILFGNLGKDVELKYTQNQIPVASLSVATSERFKDNQGQVQEKTEWHRVSVFGKKAENCHKYLSKGSKVLIEGKIRTRKWLDNSGQTRYSTEILARDVTFAGSPRNENTYGGNSRNENTYGGTYGKQQNSGHQTGGDELPEPQSSFSDDDIPF